MAWTILAALGGVGASVVAVHGFMYWRLLASRRRATVHCQDEDERDGWAAIVRLVAAESVSTIWLAAAACRPRFRSGNAAARDGVVLVGPPWLPAACLRVLARRLRAYGSAVSTWRAPRPHDTTALARLASRVEALHRATGHRGVTLLFFGSAARVAGGAAAVTDPGAIRRLILLGAPADGLGPTPSDPVCISSRDDAWVQPPERALHPAGMNVQLSAVGHLSMLVAEYVATLVHEACDDRAGP